jgi:type I restriction enzyme M protein
MSTSDIEKAKAVEAVTGIFGVAPSIAQIFRSLETRHRLTQFSLEQIQELENSLFWRNGKPYLKCLASDKDRPAKPEEVVRQLWLRKLLDEYRYPKDRIKVEKAVWFGSGVSDKSADIVVLHADQEHPYIIFEIKKPKRKDGEQQLKSYCNAEGSPIGVWSNGEELVVLHRQEPNIFQAISSIPTIDQSLQDVIKEPWTIDKLTAENKLVRERLSLKKIILDLEDLVLANAEGIDDTFDEVFKLIYAKLYDEWAAANDPTRKRLVYFRIYGESHQELYDKIDGLFKQAKNKWRGIFSTAERIRLKPGHLLTCVSFLQDVKLFNANLQVIDEAFEYLITEVAKGKKGQYFTPRWVIDMCLKMLNPKIHERVIDTACGSSGFTVHSIFYLAGEQLSTNGLPAGIVEYASTMIYSIDSSPKAVKIAKALNLIAGDGKSNVYELNSLNPPKWSEEGKAAFRPMLADFPDDETRDEANKKDFQFFDFDILMTNPPFAGNINEREILRQYRLAEKNGRTVSKIGRDILFIERNLNFLRPGGRMAIVLPQGRLNNTNDLFIRNFIFDKARVLGVVGLHGNTFKPHTGTKTSIIFLHKYTDEMLDTIREVQNRHTAEWERHLTGIRKLAAQSQLGEDELPGLLLTYLQAEFQDEIVQSSAEENEDNEAIEETNDELTERVTELESELAVMPARAKGKAELRRAIIKTKRKLAARSLLGQLGWLVSDERTLGHYRQGWLADRAAEELDYPIFFAVSQKGGKDNRGEPIYKKDEEGRPVLDKHSHLIIDHDLHNNDGALPDGIAEAFITFAKEQAFEFWKEN